MNNNQAMVAKENTLNDLTKEINNILSLTINAAQETEQFLFGPGPVGNGETPKEEPHNFQGHLELVYCKVQILNSLLSDISRKLY